MLPGEKVQRPVVRRPTSEVLLVKRDESHEEVRLADLVGPRDREGHLIRRVGRLARQPVRARRARRASRVAAPDAESARAARRGLVSPRGMLTMLRRKRRDIEMAAPAAEGPWLLVTRPRVDAARDTDSPLRSRSARARAGTPRPPHPFARVGGEDPRGRRVLGQLEITEDAGEDRNRTAPLLLEDLLDRHAR